MGKTCKVTEQAPEEPWGEVVKPKVWRGFWSTNDPYERGEWSGLNRGNTTAVALDVL